MDLTLETADSSFGLEESEGLPGVVLAEIQPITLNGWLVPADLRMNPTIASFVSRREILVNCVTNYLKQMSYDMALLFAWNTKSVI